MRLSKLRLGIPPYGDYLLCDASRILHKLHSPVLTIRHIIQMGFLKRSFLCATPCYHIRLAADWASRPAASMRYLRRLTVDVRLPMNLAANRVDDSQVRVRTRHTFRVWVKAVGDIRHIRLRQGIHPAPSACHLDRHLGRNTHLPASHICYSGGLDRSAVCRSAIPDWSGRPAMSTGRTNLLRFANEINELASYAWIMRGGHGEHRDASIRQAQEKIDS